jgi:hypothetical protein
MRVEVLNSALQNDRSTQPQHVARTFYAPFLAGPPPSPAATTAPPSLNSALPSIPWPPLNRTAALGANMTRICHVLVGFDSSKAAYFNEQRASTIFAVMWNEWTLLWEPFAEDTFSGYEIQGGKTLYCHVTTLRQINYVRVVDALLQPNYAPMAPPLPARADLNYDRVDPDACGTPFSQCTAPLPPGGCSCHKCKLVPTAVGQSCLATPSTTSISRTSTTSTQAPTTTRTPTTTRSPTTSSTTAASSTSSTTAPAMPLQASPICAPFREAFDLPGSNQSRPSWPVVHIFCSIRLFASLMNQSSQPRLGIKFNNIVAGCLRGVRFWLLYANATVVVEAFNAQR